MRCATPLQRPSLIPDSSVGEPASECPLALITLALDGTVTAWNHAAERVFGYAASEVVGQRLPIVPPEEWDQFRASLDVITRSDGTVEYDADRLHRNGSRLHTRVATAALRGPDGMVTGVVGVFLDIGVRKRREKQQRQELALLHAIVDGIPAPIFYKSTTGVYIGCNTAYAEYVGVPREHILGKTVYQIWPPERAAAYDEGDRALLASGGHQVIEGTAAYPDGSVRDVVVHKGVFRQRGEVAGQVGTIMDVTALKRTQAELDRLAHHDPLTKLPNRVAYQQRLDFAIQRSPQFAVLYMDLDGFKRVNDTLGHAAGDALLEAVAGRLRGALRSDDFLARLGGDEFTVVLPGLDDPELVRGIGDRITHAMAAPIDIMGTEVIVGVSIGCALFPADAETADGLTRKADTAMYAAKRLRNGAVSFAANAQSVPTSSCFRLEQELRTALEEDELVLHYQPKVDLRTGIATGLEALVRWQHPVLGLLAPAVFLEAAEAAGLMGRLSEWVVTRACFDSARFRADGFIVPRIAVNLSPRELHDGAILPVLQNALTAYRLPPSALEIELTEDALVQNSAASLQTLEKLRALGIRIALDDFGTGYSSLSYLTRLPLDTIKVDRAFIRDLGTNERARPVLEAIVTMARALSLEVVAEGVETEADLESVREMGCHLVQGYYFSKPIPSDELAERWLMRARGS